MDKYTIFCTTKQTEKALELGAPIEPQTSSTLIDTLCAFCGDGMYIIPTAEQMLGWLEDQGFYIRLSSTSGSVEMDCKCIYERGGTNHKIAALAVIDAALEYLNNNQKK